MSTESKLLLARHETVAALEAFDKLKDPVTLRQVADTRRTLCGVTGKLVSVEAELAVAGEGKRE